jgi:glutamate--cysteine ligase
MKHSVEKLTDFFKSGEKKSQYLGVEFEHFLIDRETIRSFSYFEEGGQRDIANTLKANGWSVDYEENGYVLGLSKEGNAISFEPGGQFEISIRALQSVGDIKREYMSVLKEVSSLLSEKQTLISLGYHPASKIDDLPLLPKERYRIMYNYFKDRGHLSRNMMKGTASTQVSIDYENEQDFIKKYRVAYYLTPFLGRIFDGAPVFEGKLYSENGLRSHIWDHTDRSRSKMPTGVFDTTFGYTAYAEYIVGSEPIFMPESDGSVHLTGHKTVGDLDAERSLSKDELVHSTSMVFPDVRLKQILEIRVADALPPYLSLALPAIIKGIFYSPNILEKYYNQSLKMSDADFYTLNAHIKKSEDFEFGCLDTAVSCSNFIEALIQDACSILSDEEVEILINAYHWIKENGSYTQYLKRHFEVHPNKYYEKVVQGGLYV